MKRDERAVLVERRVLSPDAYLLFFEAPNLPSASSPGQFTMVRTPGEGLLLRRPYSICSVEPEAHRFSLLVKVVGQGTRVLSELPLGEGVHCLGPLGTSFERPPAGARAVVVGGGVGIRTLPLLLSELGAERRDGPACYSGDVRLVTFT